MRGLVAACCLFALSACGGGRNVDASGASGATSSPALGACEPSGETADPGTVKVELVDFAVLSSDCETPPGEIAFDVTVDSDVEGHAFDVLRTDLAPDELPTTGRAQADYLSDEVEVVGSLPTLPGGEGDTLTVTLEAGKYVLICNIVDHYSRGMAISFTVA